MVPDRQKVWMDGRTDDAKTISFRLRRGIKERGREPVGGGGETNFQFVFFIVYTYYIILYFRRLYTYISRAYLYF